MSKKEPEPVKMSDILAEILEYGGITSKEPPVLYMWKTIEGIERRLEVKTFEVFLRVFGEGAYQIYIENPEIDGIDPEKFKVNSFSVTIIYANGKWSEPKVQTNEEEITPEYEQDLLKKLKERSKKMGGKVQGAMTLLSILLELYDIFKKFFGLP